MREELEELSCEGWCMTGGPTECWWEAATRGALAGTPHGDRVDGNVNRGYNRIQFSPFYLGGMTESIMRDLLRADMWLQLKSEIETLPWYRIVQKSSKHDIEQEGKPAKKQSHRQYARRIHEKIKAKQTLNRTIASKYASSSPEEDVS
jgi:hypothetical protein